MESNQNGEKEEVKTILDEPLSKKKFTTTQEDIDDVLKLFKNFNQQNIWSQVNDEKDFQTKRFELGFVNNIICCILTDEAFNRLTSDNRFRDQPRGIVIKYIVTNSWLQIDLLEMAVINSVVSQNGLSPKLLFISKDVMVHEYIDGRNYNRDDDCNEQMVQQLARLLARFHATPCMPISNQGYKQWVKMINNPFENESAKPIFIDKVHLKLLEQNEEFKKKYYDLVSEIDLPENIELNLELMNKVNSPLVFSHNDFNRGNRIVSSKDKRIYFVDLDYSNFNDRGMDLGRYFSNYQHVDDMFGNEGFPTDQEMELFLKEYRDEYARLIGELSSPTKMKEWLNDPQNSMEHLKDETKVHTLISYQNDYWFSLMMFIQNPTDEKFLIITKNRYEGFKRLKQMFIDDGTIARVLANPNKTNY